jgi:hypothetical protein
MFFYVTASSTRRRSIPLLVVFNKTAFIEERKIVFRLRRTNQTSFPILLVVFFVITSIGYCFMETHRILAEFSFRKTNLRIEIDTQLRR